MNIDTRFPPPPQHNQPPLRCDDISPARQRALNRLSEFATVAESLIGTIQEGIDLPHPGTARGFALHCFKASPFADEIAELLARSKIHTVANDHVDAPHVMLIEPRRYWGVLGPIRGDIVLFSDGHAAIVTLPLCMGCQHFEAVSLVSTDGPPQIAKLTHWTSTVRWIVRLVDESEAAPSSGQPGQDGQAAELSSDEPPASSTEQPASSNEPKARKRKLTGI